MSSKPAGERRAHPRVPASFSLDGAPDSGGVVARMVARDLSLGGLRCTSMTDFPEMTRLAVRLLLPVGRDGTTPVDLEAVVVRRDAAPASGGGAPRYELSLFFTRVDDGARRHLAAFLGE